MKLQPERRITIITYPMYPYIGWEQQCTNVPLVFPSQHQNRHPGFEAEEVKTFGTEVPMKRPGQPFELAPAYVLLASDDSSYISGQILFVNGGSIVT
jgi:NAD(P)-dependent dehydrogenase (short-subunit alcohol dehydrogenase family)